MFLHVSVIHSVHRGGRAWLLGGACVVALGGMRGFIWRGVRGFFSFFGYNEIRSMNGMHPTGMHSCFFQSYT